MALYRPRILYRDGNRTPYQRTKSNERARQCDESLVNARKGAMKRFLVRVLRVFYGFLGFRPIGSVVDCIWKRFFSGRWKVAELSQTKRYPIISAS